MTTDGQPSGAAHVLPLAGTTVIEVGGIGPGPFAGMVLAGMGATVHRIERPDPTPALPRDNGLLRWRDFHEIDLKDPQGNARARELIGAADALYEGFRPGVMERLDLGPDDCHALNPGLVYARMTGWGQHGPYAHTAGHDINYLAVSGVLDTIGEPAGPPRAPVNYVADYGAGGMMLVAAINAGLVRRAATGEGSVVDVAMVDGAAMMLADLLSRRAAGDWGDLRGTNVFDGGAPFYRTYRTADGRHMAVGALEPPFYEQFLQLLGLDDVDPQRQYNRDTWDTLTTRIASAFASASQVHWASVFDGTNACVTPVVDWAGFATNPHLVARENFPAADETGARTPAAAPRFQESRTANHQQGAQS